MHADLDLKELRPTAVFNAFHVNFAEGTYLGYIAAKCSNDQQLDPLQYTQATNPDCLVAHGPIQLGQVQTFSYAKGWDLLDYR